MITRRVTPWALAAFALVLSFTAFADELDFSGEWPVARHFDGNHLLRVALPMGGIGCGSVSLSGRGELVDWEIMNRANKTMSETERGPVSRTFFAIRIKGESHESTTMLAGPLHPAELHAAEGNCAPQSGLPRFREATFDGAFPFGAVHLLDRELPVKVTIKGFSPFVPGDSAASSLPVASLEYDVENLSGEPIEVSVAAFVRNIVGNDGNPVGFTGRRLSHTGGEKGNRTMFREGAGLSGVMCLSDGVATNSPAYGTFALSTPDADGSLTFRESFAPNRWSGTVLDFWDDLSDDGELSPRPSGGGEPHGGLCLKKTVPVGAKTPFRFAFTWNFPNRPAWDNVKVIVGNWYSRNYADAWDAAEKIVPRLGELEERSLAFTRKVLALDAPDALKEAALSNLAVLKSQTVFRVPSGHLLGWEGVFDHEGSCRGSCTHVWNYENAVACLFPDLARSMRDVEFNYAMNPENGAMDFRVALPLGAKRNGRVAADGQMGCIMKVYRDWRICGDDEWLAGIWPKVKKAMEFAWIPAEKWTWNAKWREGGWDVGKSGLMDGEQHNTMDVNYYGPNPQMGFWYLGALRAAEEMAKAMKDDDFAAECRAIYEKGSKRIDAELFNGDYYEQHITEGHGELPYQLGKCCLVDQLVGQQMAHLWGLGDLAKKENLRKTCESIMRWNFLPDFSRHFNNMRTYCAGDEAGLLMGAWPRGRLKTPFPYFGEVMTGFEYVAAAEMVFQGMDSEAMKVVKAVRDRHDGLKRNPFNEPECGHNYARSMASWNVLLAWIEMHRTMSAVQESVTCNLGFGELRARCTGAHLWSWKPLKANGAEMLFMPENAPWGKEVHGGIPICWPWFGAPPKAGMPKHGLARYSTWKFKGGEGKSGIAFELCSNEKTRSIWPHDFRLDLFVCMKGGDRLAVRLVETNTGKEPFESAWGFHPYFRVTDAERVAIDGERQPTPSVRVQSSSAEKGRCRTLADLVNGRKIVVECTDNEDWFVWNPGVDRTPLCETLRPGEWKGFYCLEPCTLVPRTLSPGESRVHEMTVTATAPEGGSSEISALVDDLADGVALAYP